MNKSYKRLSVVLAVMAFALGYILRQTSNTDNVYRIWASAKAQDTRQMAAYNSQGAASDVGTQSNVDLRPMETYYSVLRIVQDSFVERVNDDTKNKMTYDSVRTMLDSLQDPYTRFYEPDQTKVLEAAQQGKFYGIGAIFAVEKEKIDGMPTEKLSVMTVIPGSPADKVGLRTGDVIEEVDGKSVLPYDPFQKANQILKSARDNTEDREKLQKELDAEDKRIKNGMSFQKSIDTLSANLNKEFTLSVTRNGVANPLKIKVTAAPTIVDPISHSTTDKNVGYIRIRLMTQPVAEEFGQVMKEMEAGGIKSLVIDLRDCPGGSPDVAGKVASWFTPNKVLTNVLKAQNKKRTIRIPKFEAPEGSNAKPWTGKVAVMVNGGTSTVAEVLAAALKDNGVGTLVGTTTFGQALQQEVYILRDGSAVGLTTGKYTSPQGRDFNVKGLTVDVRVANAAKDGPDLQLARAIEVAKAQ